jgi:pectinesterase
LSTTSTTAQSLFILAGTYTEQVIIPARAAALTIYGYTTDTTSYTSNVVNIVHSSSLLSGAASDEATGTVQNTAANSKFYNVNIKNTYGQGSQAIALAAYGTQQGCMHIPPELYSFFTRLARFNTRFECLGSL